MALLVVVVLGLPRGVSAGQPSVQAPTGPQSGGVFTGPYSFATYINCDGGPSFNSSYTNALDGTHTFTFMGAADGSLLVRIDGGGAQLLTSCGDPTPTSTVAAYTVTYDPFGPPPTPNPTPTPTATPTPPPTGGGAGGAGPGTSPAPAGSHSPATLAPGASTLPPSPAAASPATPEPAVAPSTAAPAPATAGGQLSRLIVGTAGQQPKWHWWLSLSVVGLLTLGALAWYVGHLPRVQHWAGELASRWGLRWRLRVGPHWLRLKLAVGKFTRVHAHDVPRTSGLSPHDHTGRLTAHHHTSYPALAFLMLASTVLLGAYSVSTRADSNLSLTVLGPPPTVGATIDQPVAGQRFSVATTTVRGTCPPGLLVEVYRNGSFAGSASCDGGGLYNLVITLIPDQNDLVARDLDALGQYGPDSATVTVYYDVPPTPSPTPTPPATPTPVGNGAAPIQTLAPTPAVTAASPRPSPATSQFPASAPPAAFLLNSQQHHQTGLQAGQQIVWPVTISGGTPPYHLAWDWGDGDVENLEPGSQTSANPSHTYTKSGTYRLTIRARDAAGREAVLTLAAIVNGPVTGPAITANYATGSMLLAWLMLGATGAVALSFWLGERHKLAIARLDAASPHA